MRSLAAVLFAFTLLTGSVLADDDLPIRTSSDGFTTELTGSTAAGVESRTVSFVIVQAGMERWPAAVAVHISRPADHKSWSAVLEPRVATKAHTLRLGKGSYQLSFVAKHHRTLTRVLEIGESDVALGSLSMAQLPVLTGAVRTADGSPLVGAFVDDGNKHSAKTDPTGSFSIEVADDWPDRLQISYPGYAAKELAVPKSRTSFAFPPAIMSKGGRIDITIVGGTQETSVDLEREVRLQHFEILKTQRITKESNSVSFTDVARGDYVIVVRDEGPLQKMSSTVTLGDGEIAAKEIRIESLTVHLQVRQGERPLPNASVHIANAANRWSTDVHTDEQGNFTAEGWERGPFAFAVRANENSSPNLLFDEIQGKREATVKLVLPDRQITGQVTDSETGAPVAKASILMESRGDDSTGGTMRVVVGDDGRFAIDVRDGEHTIVADADGYIRSAPVTIHIDSGASRRNLELHLSKGKSRRIVVMNRYGVPITRALVVAAVNGVLSAHARTDDTGRATVPVPVGQSCVLYVVPQEGSFNITRIASDMTAEEQSIVVADGTATLELHASTTSGVPLPYVRFVMRFDGEMVPTEIAQTLELQREMSPVTGPDGIARIERLPPGFLELWPIRTADEESNILAVAGSAPVQVSLKDGLNVAKMTFAPK